MRRRLTGLTTRGRCVLAAGVAAAVCGLVLDERDLLRVAVFAAVLPLLAAAAVGRTRVRLHAERRLVPPRTPIGGDAEVHLDVRSTAPLATGGLLLEDTVPYALGQRPRFVVERLSRHGAVQLRYRVHPALRGVHPVGPLVARVTDPFGLAEAARELGGRQQLTAHPVVVPLAGLPTGCGRGSGEQGAGRLRAGQGEDDAVVRAYRHGDDLRKVHWRSTARRDELVVRVEEQPWRGGATVLLDHRVAAHRGSGPSSSLEWAVSMAASVAVHLQRHGQQVRLLAADAPVAAPEADPGPDGCIDAVLDALAALVPSGHRELCGGRSLSGGQELVAVLGAVGPGAVETLLQARPQGGRAVLLDVDAWAAGVQPGTTDPAEAARLLTAAGWTVAVATPASRMPAVWAEVCGARTPVAVPQ